MVPEKSRVKNLSTRYLAFYKWGVGSIILTVILLIVIYEINWFKESKNGLLFWPFYYGYFLYLWWNVNKRVYHVEFDSDFMYVAQKGQDLLIPLENIRDVNLVSMGGVYRVDLYATELFGDTFYFKPSLLYPFNHKKKEALVDVLWANIEKAKSKKQHFQRNALHS
jgi:hypothetical protein